MKALSIYIHIPFCVQKCVYCDFLSAPATDEIKNKYIEALKREISLESIHYKDYIVETIFFGGGTPTILEGTVISGIIECVRENYVLAENTEITVEMNPATASKEKMKKLISSGVNRLSIGLQSANNDELKMLGRVHNYQDFLLTYETARECGFKNINIDIMSALPGQSFESYMDTVKNVISLNPEHISAYSLIIEENTYLYDNLSKYPQIPSEEEDRKMYQMTKAVLKDAGYDRYEISNYSKKGYECKHNLVYWNRGNYVGFGIGAASMVENKRWKNIDSLLVYIDKYEKTEVEELSIEDQMEEYMFLGLRKVGGISISEFQSLFAKSIFEVYGKVIRKWTENDFLIIEGDKLSFSDKGIDISNQILSEFLF